MALNGSQVLIFVYDKANDGSEFADKYLPLGEQTGLSQEASSNLIEASSKASDHTKWLYGKSDGTLSVEALYGQSDAVNVLRACQKQKKNVYLKRSDGTNTEYFEALVETISQEFPDNDNSTLSIDFQLNAEASATDMKDDAQTAGSK